MERAMFMLDLVGLDDCCNIDIGCSNGGGFVSDGCKCDEAVLIGLVVFRSRS